jgi:hypothetical protein
MIIECLFDEEGAGNPFFKKIYNNIFNYLKILFPQYTFIHVQPDYRNQDISPSSVGSYSNFQLINPKNKKTILMSFWDRGMDPLTINDGGWEKLEIVQYLGGLGMYMNSEEINKNFNIEHLPFQYPLGVRDSDSYIKEYRTFYVPENKKRKAIFIGRLYGHRKNIAEILKKHPLFEIYDSESEFHGLKYFEKLSDYRIGLSFNGNGEFCLRDLEIMGLNLPLFRPELKTKFNNDFIPNTHYVKIYEPSISAHENFDITDEEMANRYIEKVETYIDDYEFLKNISNNGYNYYLNFTNVDYIVNLYFKLINLKKLENE